MKTSIARLSVRFAVICATLILAIGAQAAATSTNNVPKNPNHAAKKKAALSAELGNVSLLDEAYGLLASADHDYSGHRASAMHHIEVAAKALGSSVGGHGKGHEAQKTSDEQVRSAQTLLQQAVGGLTGKPHRQVEDALKQLTIALSLK